MTPEATPELATTRKAHKDPVDEVADGHSLQPPPFQGTLGHGTDPVPVVDAASHLPAQASLGLDALCSHEDQVFSGPSRRRVDRPGLAVGSLGPRSAQAPA